MEIRMEKGTAKSSSFFYAQKRRIVRWAKEVMGKVLFIRERMEDGAGLIMMNSITDIMFMEELSLN